MYLDLYIPTIMFEAWSQLYDFLHFVWILWSSSTIPLLKYTFWKQEWEIWSRGVEQTDAGIQPLNSFKLWYQIQ